MSHESRDSQPAQAGEEEEEEGEEDKQVDNQITRQFNQNQNVALFPSKIDEAYEQR